MLVVTINLPQIGMLNKGDEEGYFKMLDKRMELVKDALMLKHKLLEGTKSDVSPIHWQHGAIARLDSGETIDKLLHGGYSTISIGYIGIYEATKLVTGKSHTTPEGKEFATKILKKLNEYKDKWTKEENIQFAVYGTPAENLTHRFCSIDTDRFGEIEDITDKGYYTNSYHVDVREEIDVFTKFDLESEYQKDSTGGMISYVEIPNMNNNTTAILSMMKHIYDNITYAEFNTKSDYCMECGFDGEIKAVDGVWTCPKCNNTNRKTLSVVRRTCGLTK